MRSNDLMSSWPGLIERGQQVDSEIETLYIKQVFPDVLAFLVAMSFWDAGWGNSLRRKRRSSDIKF